MKQLNEPELLKKLHGIVDGTDELVDEADKLYYELDGADEFSHDGFSL